ncbi:MAG: DNA mismatch repair endonuclease MutL [Calditrichia bacterium]
MRRIKVLPPQIANKIAAGEVVDRPAAVVKELVENAIDAGAKNIQIVLEKAGKELIQIIDDGHGISPDEVLLAFERHATSKINSVSDLDRITTLGFRGEALPSIASVSRLEMKTKTAEAETGMLVMLEGGHLNRREEIALKQGTIISVRNLFFNTPARRNFLRSDTSEFGHINKTLKRFFLAQPEIAFKVTHNGKEVYNLPAASIDQRITDLFGKKFYEGLVYVREELDEIILDGYVCRPDMTRGNSDNQYIFLNERAIQSRNLNHAVFQGYGKLIDRSQYPQFIMFLRIPPQHVDVNVHPTKMEVRFSNERVIYHLFLSAVRKAIQKKDIVPEFTFKQTDAQRTEIDRQFKIRRFSNPRPFTPTGSAGDAAVPAMPEQMAFSYTAQPDTDSDTASPGKVSTDMPAEQPLLWQVHRRYILSQIKSGLVIIDQHVAHERVLFEKILNYLSEERPIPSQKLLFPQTLEMALDDYLIYTEIKDWLNKIGYSITELSGRTLLIEAIPADVRVGYEGKVLLEILDYYRENEGSDYQPHEKIAAAFACKNAIKSGDKLNQKEMAALVDQLFATKEPYFCPHGRPVIVTLNLEEIDKKFKRI